jgi:hypothetical protein
MLDSALTQGADLIADSCAIACELRLKQRAHLSLDRLVRGAEGRTCEFQKLRTRARLLATMCTASGDQQPRRARFSTRMLGQSVAFALSQALKLRTLVTGGAQCQCAARAQAVEVDVHER